MPNSSRLRSTWNDMKSRCYNKNVAIYPHYGGRGISVCDEWKDSFKAFEDWALSHGYNDKLTIERIDVNKGYGPDNCTWVTKHQQMKNKTNSINITINGETHNLSEWAELSGIKYATLYRRVVVYKWPVERYLEPIG